MGLLSGAIILYARGCKYIAAIHRIVRGLARIVYACVWASSIAALSVEQTKFDAVIAD